MPDGAPLRIMALRARARSGPAFAVPDRLSVFDALWSPRSDASLRRVPLVFQQMQWMIDGRTFSRDMEEVAAEETVARGSTHVWEFVNQSAGMGLEAAHPMHIHGRQFRVLDRTGGRVRRPSFRG